MVGDLTLTYEDLDLPADPGQTILVFVAEPGSGSANALNRLSRLASMAGPGSPTPKKGVEPDATVEGQGIAAEPRIPMRDTE